MCREINLFQFANIFTLISYFISLCASGSNVTVTVHQREVNGTVNQSVLLPVSYSTPTPFSTLSIKWVLFPGDTPFVRLTRLNCSSDPDRPGYNCSDHQQVASSHSGRVHIDPENGSLLLWDLQPSDSGVYEISVYRAGGTTSKKGNVTLTVYPGTASESSTITTVSGSTQNNTTPSDGGDKAMYIGIAAAVCLLIILTTCLCLLMTKAHRGSRPRHDSGTMEASVPPMEGMRQDLAEGLESTANGELMYSLIQWPESRNPPAPAPDTRAGPPESLYAFLQKERR